MRVCHVFMLLRLHAERGITFLVLAHDAHLVKRCARRLELVYAFVRLSFLSVYPFRAGTDPKALCRRQFARHGLRPGPHVSAAVFAEPHKFDTFLPKSRIFHPGLPINSTTYISF